ncbi:MAG: Asp-tRNA(Asn)/Glu-tRNA(Gln) amidotransferase subunit GatC [Candidatus Sericytochromatia bacterium]
MISKEEVLKIAKLSKLSLNNDEVEKFSHQIGDILNYVEQLNELDTTGIEPTARVIPSHNVFREDIVEKVLDIDKAFLNAPQSENNMFKVPKI